MFVNAGGIRAASQILYRMNTKCVIAANKYLGITVSVIHKQTRPSLLLLDASVVMPLIFFFSHN